MSNFGNLRERAERAIAGRPLSQVVQRTRAIVGPPLADLEGDAQRGLAAFKNAKQPTANEVAALQAIVRSMRPSALSRDGAVDALPEDTQPVFPNWDKFTDQIVPHLYTVGRVDRKRASPEIAERIGSGFLLSADLFLTNRHVVTLLTEGTDVIAPGAAEIRFRQEYGERDEAAVPVLEVLSFHEDEDAAILRLGEAAAVSERKPLPWTAAAPTADAQLAVLGYPFPDSVRNPLFVDTIFGGRLGVKRLAPGELIGARVSSLFHDCSTLGGNSGSPVVDMKTGAVVGLHRDGYFLARNEAVAAAALHDFVAAAAPAVFVQA